MLGPTGRTCPLWGLEPKDSGKHLGAGIASSQVKRLGFPSTPEHLPVGLGSQRHSRVQPFSRGHICPDPALCSQFQARGFPPELSTSVLKRRRRAPFIVPTLPSPRHLKASSDPQGQLLLVCLHPHTYFSSGLSASGLSDRQAIHKSLRECWVWWLFPW